MASIINASTSGVGGVITTADNTGILNIQTAGTTAVSVDATQNVTFTNGANLPNTFGFKNLLIDAGFTINQRAYVSGATLSSGSYGHDRWKAGASGGNYTFTQLASSTTITIASGKSLIQVVEDKNVNGTSFVLSWTGTAQARYTVNSATPSGSYAASPILITGQTVGTTMSVEFNAGTLSNPQLELGSTATSFDVRDYGRELIMCQRYFQKLGNASYVAIGTGLQQTTTTALLCVKYTTTMRASPTFAFSSLIVTDRTSFDSAVTSISNTAAGLDSTYISLIHVAGGTSSYSVFLSVASGTTGFLSLDSEL